MSDTEEKPRKRRKPRHIDIPEKDRGTIPWRELPSLENPATGRPGRRSKLSAAMLGRIQAICTTCGAPSDYFICSMIGVQVETWNRWMNEYIDLREMVDQWKAEGLKPLRQRAVRDALQEGGRMLQWMLERRDRDFKRTPVGDNAGRDDDQATREELELPPTEFL